MILKRSRDICQTNKLILKKWLDQEPLVSCVIPRHGTVCFLHYHLDIPSAEFCEKLQKETGVFFVPGSAFDIEYHLRFGFTQDEKIIKKGLITFSKWLRQFDHQSIDIQL